MRVYLLDPSAPFHFGERGVGQEETSEFPHSDTLFAALVVAWRLGKGEHELERLLTPLVEPETSATGPPFRLSSAFPYAGPVCLLPRPLVPLYGEDQAQQLDPKVGKKVEWVSWRRLEDIINSDTPPQVLADDLLMGGKVWLTPSDRAELEEAFDRPAKELRLWAAGREETVARVTVDRVHSGSALYFQGQVRFADGCGLYALAEFEPLVEERYRAAVADGLRLLGDLGLGGRRSVGLGQFELREMSGDMDLEQPVCGDESNHLLLSLYHPTRAEVEAGVLKGGRYRLVTRRGWFFSTTDTGQRRRAVRMLREGSIIGREATGDVVDVAPKRYAEDNHPVYRSGLALTVRCRRWSDV